MNLYQYLRGSFDTKSENGASARKLTAFIITTMVVLLHLWYFRYQYKSPNSNFELLTEILIIDYSFISLLLGLTTIQELIKLKNGNKNETPTPSKPADNSVADPAV